MEGDINAPGNRTHRYWKVVQNDFLFLCAPCLLVMEEWT